MITGKWKKIETFDEWATKWCENCRGPRNHEVASNLLYCLHEISRLPFKPYSRGDFILESPGDEEQFKQYLTALYLAMEITMTDPDEKIAGVAKRAVFLLLKAIKGILNVHRLPHVLVGKAWSFDDHRWVWDGYREMPKRMLTFFSHPTCYASGTELWEEISWSWAFAACCSESERVNGKGIQVSGATEFFKWPDCQTDTWRNHFLRVLIINKHVWRPKDMPKLLNPFFDLLIDARNSEFALRGGRVAMAEQEWPKFTDTHAERIDSEIYRLGITLGKEHELIERGYCMPKKQA